MMVPPNQVEPTISSPMSSPHAGRVEQFQADLSLNHGREVQHEGRRDRTELGGQTAWSRPNLSRASVTMYDLSQRHAIVASAPRRPRRALSIAVDGAPPQPTSAGRGRGVGSPILEQGAIWGAHACQGVPGASAPDILMPWNEGIVSIADMHKPAQHVAGMPRAPVVGAHAHLRDLAMMGGLVTSSRSIQELRSVPHPDHESFMREDEEFAETPSSADVHDRIPGGSSLLHRHRDGNQQPSRTFSVGGFGNAVPLNVDPFPHKRVREVPDALDAGYSNFTGGMDGADDPLGSSIDGQALTPMSPKEVAMEPVPRPPQFCHAAQSAGAALGIAIFLAVLPWEMSSRHPAANDMLGVIGLVSVFWMFEVMPLPASSLLPMFLMPALGILDGGQVAASYWGKVQMMFVGAFIVDVGIEHVNLHQRLALKVLLGTGVERPWIVLVSFSFIAFSLSTVCSNTATTVMLVPFATGLLDMAAAQAIAKGQGEDARKLQCAVLLGIAFAGAAGGMSTLIGTPPNGVLAGQPILQGELQFAGWFFFAMPVAILVFLLSMIVLQVSVLSGVRLQLDEDLLALQYEQLGDVSRDEIAAGGVLLLQVFLWISRPYLLEPIVGPGLNDAATACGSCVLMFVIPSVKRPGEALLTWSVAQQHLPWGILLLLGAGFALADGCEASGLTLVLGRHLAEALAGLSQIKLVFTIVSALSVLTQLTSNVATANTLLPLLSAVSQARLTHPMLLLLPATIACSFAFMLPAANASNSVVFATQRLSITDFIGTGGLLTLACVVIGSPVIYYMADAVFGVLGPFPQWACNEKHCAWIPLEGFVDGIPVSEQACALSVRFPEYCFLRNGSLVELSLFAPPSPPSAPPPPFLPPVPGPPYPP